MGKIVTHNQSLMMMMLSLRIRTMFFTPVGMVDASWRYWVITGLNLSTTQPSLHTGYLHWSLYMIIQSVIWNNHTVWNVNTRSSRCLGKLITRIKITRFWKPSTQRSGSEANRSPMTISTSRQAIHLMTNCLISGISSTGLPTRYLESDLLKNWKYVKLIHGGKFRCESISSWFNTYLTSFLPIFVQTRGTGQKLKSWINRPYSTIIPRYLKGVTRVSPYMIEIIFNETLSNLLMSIL